MVEGVLSVLVESGFSSQFPWALGIPRSSIIRVYIIDHKVNIHQFSHSVMSDSLQRRGLQHTRPPCLSSSPGVRPSSCPLNLWYYPNHLILCRPLLLLPPIFPQNQGLFQWIDWGYFFCFAPSILLLNMLMLGNQTHHSLEPLTTGLLASATEEIPLLEEEYTYC